jgi:predicted RNA-binding protein
MGIFSDVHAAGKKIQIYLRLRAQTLRGFFTGGYVMCLSTVYKGEQKPENIVLENVQRIDCQEGQVLLTDLLERQAVVVGELVSVDLVNNVAVVRERA